MYLAIIQCKVRSFLISFFIIDFHPVHLEILLDFFLFAVKPVMQQLLITQNYWLTL